MEEEAGIAYGPTFDLRILITGIRYWLQSLHVDGSDEHARRDYLFTRMAPRANPEHHCGGTMISPDTAVWRMGTLATQSVMRSLLDESGRLRENLLEGIEAYTDEVLFLAGDCSLLIGPTFQERQMGLFPSARLEVIESAGHMMFTDRPDASIAAIGDFLSAGR